jgi:hypothetical protein
MIKEWEQESRKILKLSGLPVKITYFLIEFHPLMVDDNTNLNVTATYNNEDTLEKLKRARRGSHYIIVYSDLRTLRKIYSQHIKRQIEEKKEIVLILPHH